MIRKTVQWIPRVGHVHTKTYGPEEECWVSWITARSERHANRLIHRLNWYRQPGYPGGFFRHTWYDPTRRRLHTRAGYDV